MSEQYSFTFFLKQERPGYWIILAEKGHVLYEFNGGSNAENAMDYAVAWASSWRSAVVRFYDEKDEKRD